MTESRIKLAGVIATVLVTAFLLMDAGMKVAEAQMSVEATVALGFTREAVRPLGLILLIATFLYAWPPTAMLGAILVTAYLGGAVAIQTQQNAPLFSHILFGVYLGLILWGGLFLRSAALRRLIPIARKAPTDV